MNIIEERKSFEQIRRMNEQLEKSNIHAFNVLEHCSLTNRNWYPISIEDVLHELHKDSNVRFVKQNVTLYPIGKSIYIAYIGKEKIRTLFDEDIDQFINDLIGGD